MVTGHCHREADTIPTDTVPTDAILTGDRDRVRVLGIGLGIEELVVGLVLVTLLQSSFVGTKSVEIASVRIVWCTHCNHTYW